jgi:hypothetical protein
VKQQMRWYQGSFFGEELWTELRSVLRMADFRLTGTGLGSSEAYSLW